MALTKRQLYIPDYSEDHRRNYENVRKALLDYTRQLNESQSLTIDQAQIEASYGIKFPATQNAQTDANTLDDYEEGTWTPAITFATPGDLNIAYSLQSGEYTKVGREVLVRFDVFTSSFTFTTAAGQLRITGLPFTPGANASGVMAWQGITKANYTHINCRINSGSSFILAEASGSGQARANIAAADTPSAGGLVLSGEVIYRI